MTFRDLKGMDEFLAAEQLQRVVWGEGDVPDPADLMMVLQHEGGLVGGAFQSDELVGYVFGFPDAGAERTALAPSRRASIHARARPGAEAETLSARLVHGPWH